MNKPVLLLLAPVATQSGYGHRSRDIACSLIKSDKYDVKIWSTRWGNTPMNALDATNPKHKLIIDRLLENPQLPQQPDINVQITVPNEFQRFGKFNIGITAGIETTIAAAPWIEGCNRMDLVLVSSEHAKKVLVESKWYKQDERTGQPAGELSLTTPIEVLFEGVDLETYFKTNDIHKTVNDQLKQIPEQFCYLFVGHWLNGEIGQDRKDVGMLIRTFLEAFKNKQNKPALVLKTSQADFSPVDRNILMDKIRRIYEATPGTNLPNVYVLHGDLSDAEMNSLYNHPKVKAHITFTKGEGYGRPLAEASTSQKIVIAPNYSGHLDFLKHAIMLPGELRQIHQSAVWKDVLIPESMWFTVDYGYAINVMRDVFENYKNYERTAKSQGTLVRKEFSFEKMDERLNSILTERVPEFPKQVQLKLPQLKKIELPKLKKVEA
jgi:glycosyltransferase involved in cell wall biosynthesis